LGREQLLSAAEREGSRGRLIGDSLIFRINRYEKRFNQILLELAVGFNQSRTKEILKSSFDFLGMKLNATEQLVIQNQAREVQHLSKLLFKVFVVTLVFP